ncbi:hypothetical protein GA0070607_6454 [Micromonospora coriariae]|uniref:Enoyl-(Acyl carrier protein) reductase n=1 Tax=Micromonospora coriariae TaxID=285665 RepID=A0A1C4YAJ1_9ACTN|nr:SDR family oxidoreductase [Micromonospora coriariae]SCF17351.1 hypothetical protein GA0070607_6454 [Micromonospora coriariae]
MIGKADLPSVTEGYPLRRVGRPDVAAAVTFLASSAADFITGVVLPFDGGLSIASPAAWLRPDLRARWLCHPGTGRYWLTCAVSWGECPVWDEASARLQLMDIGSRYLWARVLSALVMILICSANGPSMVTEPNGAGRQHLTATKSPVWLRNETQIESRILAQTSLQRQ